MSRNVLALPASHSDPQLRQLTAGQFDDPLSDSPIPPWLSAIAHAPGWSVCPVGWLTAVAVVENARLRIKRPVEPSARLLSVAVPGRVDHPVDVHGAR